MLMLGLRLGLSLPKTITTNPNPPDLVIGTYRGVKGSESKITRPPYRRQELIYNQTSVSRASGVGTVGTDSNLLCTVVAASAVPLRLAIIH